VSQEPSPIAFNRPFIVGKELYYIAQAVLRGKLAGNGYFTGLCQEWFEQRYGAPRVFLTHSCTAALEMATLLCGIGRGDEVIMPSYTFVSTASSVLIRGARPVFVDIRPDTLNMDENLVEARVSAATRAVLPVHYAGVGCEMDTILEIARRHRLRVIEDAAQGVDATYKGRPLGCIGDVGCWSFHETKNFISGEGGAVSVNDPDLIERAEVIWEKGTNRARFFRGEVDAYTWTDLGSSFLPSELVAAFLYAQLEEASVITERRRQIFESYWEGLLPLHERGVLRMPRIPAHCQHNFHMFHILVEDERTRDGLIKHLGQRGILAVFHYVPLHLSPMGRKLGYSRGEFPMTEKLSSRLLRLPCYFELEAHERERVVAEIESFFTGNGRGS
jgi:dTDP-4-amino-4,6-dideoxygalactose transaminase